MSVYLCDGQDLAREGRGTPETCVYVAMASIELGAKIWLEARSFCEQGDKPESPTTEGEVISRGVVLMASDNRGFTVDSPEGKAWFVVAYTPKGYFQRGTVYAKFLRSLSFPVPLAARFDVRRVSRHRASFCHPCHGHTSPSGSVFRCELVRMVEFLDVQEPELWSLREVATGYRYPVANAWFRGQSDERQRELTEQMDIDATSSSDFDTPPQSLSQSSNPASSVSELRHPAVSAFHQGGAPCTVWLIWKPRHRCYGIPSGSGR